MAMTEAERKAARKAAYLRWYAKKKGKAAVNRPKASAGPAGKKAGPGKQAQDVVKCTERLVKKNSKAVGQVKDMLKDAAALLADAYKTKDEKLVSSVLKSLGRGLSLSVSAETEDQNGSPRKSVWLNFPEKTFRVPKDAAEGVQETAEEPEQDEQDDGVEEIVVDPATAERLCDSPDYAKDILISPEDSPKDEDEEDEDYDEAAAIEDDEDYDEDDEDEDEDDELTDEEKDELVESRRRREEEDDIEGRKDAMAEFDAQGAEWGEQ